MIELPHPLSSLLHAQKDPTETRKVHACRRIGLHWLNDQPNPPIFPSGITFPLHMCLNAPSALLSSTAGPKQPPRTPWYEHTASCTADHRGPSMSAALLSVQVAIEPCSAVRAQAPHHGAAIFTFQMIVSWFENLSNLRESLPRQLATTFDIQRVIKHKYELTLNFFLFGGEVVWKSKAGRQLSSPKTPNKKRAGGIGVHCYIFGQHKKASNNLFDSVESLRRETVRVRETDSGGALRLPLHYQSNN